MPVIIFLQVYLFLGGLITEVKGELAEVGFVWARVTNWQEIYIFTFL